MIFLISCKLILSKFFISWALDYSTNHFIFFFLVGIGVHKRNVRKCINHSLNRISDQGALFYLINTSKVIYYKSFSLIHIQTNTATIHAISGYTTHGCGMVQIIMPAAMLILTVDIYFAFLGIRRFSCHS